MSLVVASGLSLAYGPKVLFQDAGLSIGPRDRIGLVGANGTGKAPLPKMVSGAGSPRLRPRPRPSGSPRARAPPTRPPPPSGGARVAGEPPPETFWRREALPVPFAPTR